MREKILKGMVGDLIQVTDKITLRFQESIFMIAKKPEIRIHGGLWLTYKQFWRISEILESKETNDSIPVVDWALYVLKRTTIAGSLYYIAATEGESRMVVILDEDEFKLVIQAVKNWQENQKDKSNEDLLKKDVDK